MLKTVARELDELCAAVELLEAQLPRLSKQEQIDVCARVVSFKNTAERIEKYIKQNIRGWRGAPDHLTMGYVKGDCFRAFINIFPVTRLDQGALQLDHPRIFGRFLRTRPESRVSFEAR